MMTTTSAMMMYGASCVVDIPLAGKSSALASFELFAKVRLLRNQFLP
jgi:hypothetical protein